MPYIRQADREIFNPFITSITQILKLHDNKKGNLNYTITMLIKEHLENKGISYDTLSDITGVLNDVKTEFERQVVANYEDLKITENGEIYEKV